MRRWLSGGRRAIRTWRGLVNCDLDVRTVWLRRHRDRDGHGVAESIVSAGRRPIGERDQGKDRLTNDEAQHQERDLHDSPLLLLNANDAHDLPGTVLELQLAGNRLLDPCSWILQ